MKKKEELIELMLTPKSRQEAKERKLHARQFFQGVLLPRIREGDIKTTKDVYDALTEYRQLHNTTVNIAHVFIPVHESMTRVIAQYQVGQPPLDFFEVDFAFSLLRDAITKDNRFFSDGVKPDRMVRETFRSAVKKLSRDIELEKASLRISPA